MRTAEQRKMDEIYETCVVLFEELGVKLEQLRVMAEKYGQPLKKGEPREVKSAFPEPAEILSMVCDTLTQRVDEVAGNKRYSTLCDARYIYSKITKELWPTITLREIGIPIGGRDHTTVINCLKQADNFYFDDPEFVLKYDRCKMKVMEKVNENLINKQTQNG